MLLFQLPAWAESQELSSHRPLRSQHSAAHPSTAVKVSRWRCVWSAPLPVLVLRSTQKLAKL